MNQIITRQNMDQNLKIQYGARTFYNYAEVMCIIAWIVSIISVVMDVYVSDELSIKNFVIAICSVVTVLLQIGVKKYTKYAAAFRMYFDYELFGWSNETYHGFKKEDLFEKAEDIVRIRKQKSSIRMKNTGKDSPRGVRDWYDNIESLEDGNDLINECQQQNMWWTRKLSRVQDHIFTMVFIIILVVLAFKFFDLSVSQLVIFLLSWITVIINFGIEFNRSLRQKELLKCFERHNKYVSSHQSISEDYLREMQELIDERRLLPAIILNVIHDKWSNILHKKYQSRKDI